jgi:hypothetical protein
MEMNRKQSDVCGNNELNVLDIMDGTSIEEFQARIDGDNGAFGDTEVFNKLRGFSKSLMEENTVLEARIQERLDLLREAYSEYSVSVSEFQGTYTDYAIRLGGVLIELKEDVRKRGYQWGIWAKQNLGFLNGRTRQTFMQLAGIPNASQYTFLGKDRLLKLQSVTKNLNGTDPIRSILREYEITLDPKSKLEEFKADIDSVLFAEKAKKKGLVVDRQKVKGIILKGTIPGSLLLRALRTSNDQGKDPNDILDLVSSGQEVPKSDRQVNRLQSYTRKLEKSLDLALAEDKILPNGEIVVALERILARAKGTPPEGQRNETQNAQ